MEKEKRENGFLKIPFLSGKEPVLLVDFSDELTFLNYNVESVLPYEITCVPFLKNYASIG